MNPDDLPDGHAYTMDLAQFFVQRNLRACCRDLLILETTGILPSDDDAVFVHLIQILKPVVGSDRALSVGQSLVKTAAFEFRISHEP